MIWMVIVSGPVQVCRHGRVEQGSILLTIELAELQSGDFCQSVSGICRLQRSAQQAVLDHGLWRFSGVDAGTAQVQEPLASGLIGCVHGIGRHSQVLINELRRICAIGQDSAYSGRREDDALRTLPLEKLTRRMLIGQVQFAARARQHLSRSD